MTNHFLILATSPPFSVAPGFEVRFRHYFLTNPSM